MQEKTHHVQKCMVTFARAVLQRHYIKTIAAAAGQLRLFRLPICQGRSQRKGGCSRTLLSSGMTVDSISASVPHCLRAAKFTNQESVDRALQAADETAETMHLLKKCNVFMARGRARKLG